MESAKKFSVVIPTYNRKSSILELLERIYTIYPQNSGFDMEIIVVNDGSSDGTRKALALQFPGVTVINGDGSWWWTRSVNEGCRHALENNSNANLLFNDDIFPEKKYFENLLTAAQNEPDAIIGSLNLTDEKEKRLFFSGVPSFCWWSGKNSQYYDFLSSYDPELSGLQPSVVLPGRGLWIPAGVFDRIGFFDQRHLPQYKADYDFVLRAHENGLKTLISWDAVLLVNVAATGKGATFVKRPLTGFIGSLFNKHSRNSVYKNLFYYFRHYPAWALPLLPVTGLLVTMRQFHSLFKNRKY